MRASTRFSPVLFRSLRLCRAFGIALGLLLSVATVSIATAHAKPALVVYPGSFDPIHKGHIAELGQALSWARKQMGEVEGMVLPDHDRPIHVPGNRYAFSKEQRQHLAQIACGTLEGVQVCKPFRNGTETRTQLSWVARRYQGTHELYLLLGEDAFRKLSSWKGHDEVLRAFNVIVSVDPNKVGKTPAPGVLLGSAARSYVSSGDPDRFQEPQTGRTIEYIPVRFPEIRSRSLLLKMMSGSSVRRFLPSAVDREIDRPEYRASLDRYRSYTSKGIAASMKPFLGSEVAKLMREDPTLLGRVIRLGPNPSRSSLAKLSRDLSLRVSHATTVATTRRDLRRGLEQWTRSASFKDLGLRAAGRQSRAASGGNK